MVGLKCQIKPTMMVLFMCTLKCLVACFDFSMATRLKVNCFLGHYIHYAAYGNTTPSPGLQ